MSSKLQVIKNCFDDLQANSNEKRKFIDDFLSLCDSADLMHLSNRLGDFKRDFIRLLPNEIVEIILSNLDWQTLLICAQVSSTWNLKLNHSFNKLWYNWCVKVLPLNDENQVYAENINYKEKFLTILRNSNDLENGRLFQPWSVGPAELNAIATYNNIIASATHIAKFWKLEQNEWTCFKTLQLQSRACCMKFDDKYLVISTYFLTIDLYSISSNEFLFQYMGHTSSISSFDFNQSLMLIVSGSPDDTVKFWSMNTDIWKQEKNMSKLLIKTQDNLVWPVRISIQKFNEQSYETNQNEESYLVLVLCANGFIFLNYIQKIDEFKRKDAEEVKSDINLFAFRYNLLISDDFLCILNLNEDYNDFDDDILATSNRSRLEYDYNTNVLNAFIITDNNSNQTKKIFIKKWKIFKDEEEQILRADCLDSESDQLSLKKDHFLNKRILGLMDIDQFEIISFGYKYCIFIDDKNKIYLTNLKTKSINLLNLENIYNPKTDKIFKLMLNNYQEQFIFGGQRWLDGFDLSSLNYFESNSVAFAFYSYKRNEIFVINWKNF